MDTDKVPGWGADLSPDHRPGVPMEKRPRPIAGAHVDPAQQEPTVEVFHRREIDHLTAVFGTAQPPKGVSGLVRKLAYRMPEHRARHWLLLLMADRLDMLEKNLRGPAGIVGAGMTAIAGAWIARRMWRRGGLVPKDRRGLRRRLRFS